MYYTKRNIQDTINIINEILEKKFPTSEIRLSCKDNDIERDCLTVYSKNKPVTRFTDLFRTSDKVHAMRLLAHVLNALQEEKQK